MELLFEIFDKSIAEKSFLEVYMSNDDLDKFWLGEINSYSNDHFSLYLYSNRGEFDGLLWSQIKIIHSVSWGSEYIKKFNLLRTPERIEKKYEKWRGKLVFIDVLKKIKKEKILCSIEISELTNVEGYIKEITKKEVIVSEIDNLGIKESLSWFRLEDVTEIRIDSMELKKRAKLIEKEK